MYLEISLRNNHYIISRLFQIKSVLSHLSLLSHPCPHPCHPVRQSLVNPPALPRRWALQAPGCPALLEARVNCMRAETSEWWRCVLSSRQILQLGRKRKTAGRRPAGADARRSCDCKTARKRKCLLALHYELCVLLLKHFRWVLNQFKQLFTHGSLLFLATSSHFCKHVSCLFCFVKLHSARHAYAEELTAGLARVQCQTPSALGKLVQMQNKNRSLADILGLLRTTAAASTLFWHTRSRCFGHDVTHWIRRRGLLEESRHSAGVLL